jgi:hypothetical protein
MERKTPGFEDEFWACVGAGDGVHCPLRTDCDTCSLRTECDADTEDGWCLDRNLDFVIHRYERLAQKCDQEFVPPGCDFVFRHPCKLFRLIEFAAERYLHRTGVSYPPVPTNLAMLADEENGVEIRLVPLNAYHGVLWRSQGKWIVQLNANDTSARKRFTLFHEVFHIRAHLKTTPVFSKIGCKTGSFNESLADYFAACVLAPPYWVRKEWAKFKDIAKMAAHFKVPYFVMFVMLKRVGLAVLLLSLLTLLASETPFC